MKCVYIYMQMENIQEEFLNITINITSYGCCCCTCVITWISKKVKVFMYNVCKST